MERLLHKLGSAWGWARFLFALSIAYYVLLWIPFHLAKMGWGAPFAIRHGLLDQVVWAGLGAGAWYLLLYVVARPLFYSSLAVLVEAAALVRELLVGARGRTVSRR